MSKLEEYHALIKQSIVSPSPEMAAHIAAGQAYLNKGDNPDDPKWGRAVDDLYTTFNALTPDEQRTLHKLAKPFIKL